MGKLTYLLTPWCRVLLEKLTGLQLVKKFPAFHETRRFITALTSVRHLSLSWASPIQSIYPHPTSWRSILILSTHLRLGLPSGLFPSGFPTKTLYTPSPHPYAPNLKEKILPHATTCTNVLAPKESTCSLRTTALFPRAWRVMDQAPNVHVLAPVPVMITDKPWTTSYKAYRTAGGSWTAELTCYQRQMETNKTNSPGNWFTVYLFLFQ